MRASERERLLFWVFTGLLAALMVGSAARALLDYPWARASFEHLGYPTYIIVPLEIAKLLGVAAVLSNVSPFLKEPGLRGVLLPPAPRPERARGGWRRPRDDGRVGFGAGAAGGLVPLRPQATLIAPLCEFGPRPGRKGSRRSATMACM
jgi:hypothetical protein